MGTYSYLISPEKKMKFALGKFNWNDLIYGIDDKILETKEFNIHRKYVSCFLLNDKCNTFQVISNNCGWLSGDEKFDYCLNMTNKIHKEFDGLYVNVIVDMVDDGLYFLIKDEYEEVIF